MTGVAAPRNPRVNWRNSQSRGLIGWWPNFNSNSVSIKEITGLSGDAAAQGAGSLSWQTPPRWFPPATANTTWGFRGAFTPPADSTPWTMCCWGTRPSTGDFLTMMFFGSEATNKGPHLMWYNAAGFLRAAIYGSTSVDVSLSGVLAVGEFAHLAFTYDGANTRSYVNGKLVGGPTAATYQAGSSFAYLQTMATGNRCPTPIYDARIYNRALSADELTRIYKDPSRLWTHRRSRGKAPAVVGGFRAAWASQRSRVLGAGVH